MSEQRRPEGEPGGTEVLPGLVRVAAWAWLRSAAWGVETSMRISARLARAAVSPDATLQLVSDVRSGLRSYARELLGITELDQRVRQLVPNAGRFGAAGSEPLAPRSNSSRGNGSVRTGQALRELGAELLRESADVSYEDGAHPAYARILQELAPDEGRILRLLMVEGPQPAIDVRAANLIGVGSQLVAPGLNMIGAEAGLRHVEHVPAYLNNLHRLGLVEFSREPLDDPMRYQVLEAQPDAIEAIGRAGRAKTVHRSVKLTPFGRDFCEVCLPLDTAEIEALTGP